MKPEYNPFEDVSGYQSRFQRSIDYDQMGSTILFVFQFLKWLQSNIRIVLLVCAILFGGSLAIASASQRPNDRTTVLERLQIGAISNASTALIVGALSTGLWAYLRKNLDDE